MGETRVLKNGAIYDMERKRIVTVKPELAEKNTQITVENAGIMQAQRHERKRERVQAGALAAVRDKLPDKFDGVGDDWIEAISEQIARKALDPLDPKQVDAARFLIKEAGYSEEAAQAQDIMASATDFMRELASFAASIAGNASDNYNYRKHDDVIDVAGEAGEASDEGEGGSSDGGGG